MTIQSCMGICCIMYIMPATIEQYESSFKHTQKIMQHTYKKDDIYLDGTNRVLL